MIYAMKIESLGIVETIKGEFDKVSSYVFNTWKELEKFLIINMKGTPDEISLRIMDCFSRVSKESTWMDPIYPGFDVIKSSDSSLCFIIWNNEIITNKDLYDKISNDGLKCIFLEEINIKLLLFI